MASRCTAFIARRQRDKIDFRKKIIIAFFYVEWGLQPTVYPGKEYMEATALDEFKKDGKM